jgi:Tol biopolymer transport system component/DNA-binding winged helix-turn-helix (wHTH) protein
MGFDGTEPGFGSAPNGRKATATFPNPLLDRCARLRANNDRVVKMDPAAPPSRIVCFGVYQCDLHSGELRKGGARVRLPDQPFRVLAILLDRPGQLVTRQELQERLWPGQPYGDFDDGLNTAVNKLRSALSDNAEKPRFIETVPKHGYRFIAPVELNGARSEIGRREPEAEGQEPRPSSGEATLRRKLSAFYRLLTGAAVAAAVFALWWMNPLPPPRITRIDQVTTSSRIDVPVKPVSAAGRVYYLARAGDHHELMQTWIGQGDGKRIAGPEKASVVMDISPDASSLLLASAKSPGSPNQLWTMPASGGAPESLGVRAVTDAAFSPDGNRIAYIRGDSLWIMGANGRNARRIATLPQGGSWLAWSPDGRRFRFTVGPLLEGASTSLWEISSDGKSLHRLLRGWSHPASECCGSWTPDGRYYLFTSSHSGRPNVWALRDRGSFWRRSPRGPFQLTSGPDTPWGGTAGRDGRHIFFYNGVWRENMQSLDLKTGQFSPFRFGGRSMPAAFSRDGKRIAYNGPPRGALYRSLADGTEQVELAPASMNPSFPRWSPDGKWIAFGGQLPGQPVKTYVVRADGGSPQPLLANNFETRDVDWSGDGKSLVVASAVVPPGAPADESGTAPQNEGPPYLLIVDFAKRRAREISGSAGLAMCRWSPDGRYISATSVTGNPNHLKLWDVSAAKWRVIASGESLGISVWSPDSRYLYFQDLAAPGEPLRRYDVQRQTVEPVAEFSQILRSGVGRCALYSITPDGSPLIGFTRSFYDLFSAQLSLL